MTVHEPDAPTESAVPTALADPVVRARAASQPAGIQPTGIQPEDNPATRAARQRRRSATAGFDRLRAHQPGGQRGPAESAATVVGRDAHGKRALYSGAKPPMPTTAGVVVTCSRCRRTSTVGLGRALRVLTPSLHLPVLRAGYPSWLRCPSCGKHSWVRLGLRVRPTRRPT